MKNTSQTKRLRLLSNLENFQVLFNSLNTCTPFNFIRRMKPPQKMVAYFKLISLYILRIYNVISVAYEYACSSTCTCFPIFFSVTRETMIYLCSRNPECNNLPLTSVLLVSIHSLDLILPICCFVTCGWQSTMSFPPYPKSGNHCHLYNLTFYL